MPEAKEFMKGFGFVNGMSYHGYKLIRIDGTHKNTGHHHYEYDFTLIFDISKAEIPRKEFFDMFVFDDKIINSSYGNPYKCSLEKDHYMDKGIGMVVMTVYLSGHSHRA